MKKNFKIKVQLIEIDNTGKEIVIEEDSTVDVSEDRVNNAQTQRKKNSGISNINRAEVLLKYAIMNYLSHY